MADAMKLLPCPFCGGEASIERFGNTRVSTQYSCDDCGCFLETGEEFNHGRAWNRRASPPAREEAPAEGAGDAWKPLYDRHGYLNDPEGLARIRSGLLEVKDWHDLPGAIVNCNSLARLLDTIEALRNRTSEPEAGAVEDGVFLKEDGSRLMWMLRGAASFWVPALDDHPAPATADKLRVDHADIAARLNPELFSSDPHVAGRAASPYAVSIKRNEAVDYVDRVIAAAIDLAALNEQPQ